MSYGFALIFTILGAICFAEGMYGWAVFDAGMALFNLFVAEYT